MRNKLLHLDNFTESLASVSKYKNGLYQSKDQNHAKMIKSIKNIMKGELTERQLRCITLYYGENMKLKDISSILNIGIPTISRHIKKAKARIKKMMSYYF